jgi:hypothetical protein
MILNPSGDGVVRRGDLLVRTVMMIWAASPTSVVEYTLPSDRRPDPAVASCLPDEFSDLDRLLSAPLVAFEHVIDAAQHRRPVHDSDPQALV